MSEAIAAMWKDVGVNVKVEVIEYSVRAQKNRERASRACGGRTRPRRSATPTA